MFSEEFTATANAAKAKYALLACNPAGYFFASMLAGMYVGLDNLALVTLGNIAGGILCVALPYCLIRVV